MITNANKHKGFTLWELLVAMLVMGIILGLGVPNFLAFNQNNAMTATVNDYVSAVHMSRNEAVKRQQPVTLCLSENALAANPVCDGDGDGIDGYIVFVDVNDTDADGFPDGNGVRDGGEVLIVQRDVPRGSIRAFFDSVYLNYGVDGFLSDGLGGLGNSIRTALFCDERGNANGGNGESLARVITTTPPGRPTLRRDMATVAAAVGSTGGVCP